jgi:uncharacterized membrane protein
MDERMTDPGSSQHAATTRDPAERGDKTTRFEAFVDAAFAFALTLLAIGGDHIPASIAELEHVLRGVPAYAASFMLVLQFWTGHTEWSRRYGLDDATSRRLSLALVFLVMIFVYPLRMVFSTFFSAVTRGWLPANFTVSSYSEVPVLFITFGVAFGSLGIIMWLLYRHAWNRREALGLDATERAATQSSMRNWELTALVATLSILAALLIPARASSGWLLGVPGYLYFSLSFIRPLNRLRVARAAQAR